MSKLPLLFGAAVVAGGLFYVFTQWERSAREHWVVFFILGMLIVEASLYGNYNNVPRGIFHPGTGSFQFRLPEVVISVALLARLAVKGWPLRIGFPALAWTVVAAWWTLEMVEGLLRHNSTVYLPYEAKAIIYVMGGYALASGVPVRRFLEGRGFERTVRWSALIATVLIAMTMGKVSYNVHLPLVPLSDTGPMGTDAAVIFLAVGIIGLLFELTKEHRSRRNLVAVVPLVLSPFFAYQRGVLLMAGAAVLVMLLVASGRTARRRLRVRAGEVLVTVLAVVGGALAVAIIPAVTAQKSVTAPFSSTINRTLGTTLSSRAKQESAQDRLTKWDVALRDAEQEPILGQGLGFEYSYFQTGPNVFIVTDLTENIGLDLWLRTGFIGLGVFLLAVVLALANGFATWRLHPDPMVAVFALALTVVVIGLLAAGQVESIFENYRLATVLGLSLGMLRSAVTSGGGGPTAMRSYQAMRQYEVI